MALPCQLYLISPPTLAPEHFAVTLAEALDAAPGLVASFQLRLKTPDGLSPTDDAVAAAVKTLEPVTRARDVAFLLNDRPDLAAALDIDGCHIGQDDIDYATARGLLGDDKIIGVTCHNSKHLAFVAGEAGADYVAFGAFYATNTKPITHRADPDLLRWWQASMELPCVAIGGITPDNAPPIIDAGADFLAVSSGVWDHEQGATAAIRAFAACLN